ncbi:MAG TPA: xanthine dehydrogenase family protein molybdopterin-binding subunit [Usitatibacter sp.]|nr:xanthine dehydrogenase family protein molybdopterin-binding subunit [Usitatibacter sp.]
MNNSVHRSRRRFLKSSAALGGVLVVGFFLPAGRGRFAEAQEPKKGVPPNAFVRIEKDGAVTVVVKHLEFGQGVTTSLPMILAEELECDWSRVRAELAPAAPEYAHTAFGIQMTGGSSSVWNSWEQLRTAGAQARTMLVEAAARQWKVDPGQCRAEKGFVHGPGKRRLSYGQLTAAASRLPVPEHVTLKPASEFRRIGLSTRRLDSAEKAAGRAKFGMDVQRKGLHTALVARPPVFGARVKSLDADKVKSVPGVTHVVALRNGVAVVGNNFWAAKKGRDALQVEWDLGPNAALSTEALGARLREAMKAPGAIARKAPPAPAAAAPVERTISAEYEVPFLAHAPMEPLNCTVELDGDGAQIWTGTQFQGVDHPAAAKALGLPLEKVRLNTMLAGGGFGRRANPASDFVVEACELARRTKVPVKVVWTREDDIRGGYYRPMVVHRVEVGLDGQGAIAGWKHAIAGPSIMAGTPFEPMMVKNGVDPTSVEGVADTPYALAGMEVTLHTVDTGVPVLWWRSVGHSHAAFVMETLIDEIAAAANKDPVALRRELLANQPRVRNVLEVAAAKGGWGTALPKGRARGIAVHESFGSVCAQVAEVSLQDGAPRVHRIVAAFDCGLVVNPLGVEAQVQSAIAFGLGAALFSEITFADGRVVQSNFHDYRVLRLEEMPEVEVHLTGGGDKPTGVGEPATPPVAPAVANALFALTGKRARKLPLASQAWT